MRNRLERITLKGFKTIRSLENFEPGSLTVLIGPNGAGKSNFISFFRMMSWALADSNNLPLYVGQQGGASTFLHDGPTRTREIETEITIRTDSGDNQYSFRLAFAAGDAFIFADERYRFSGTGFNTVAPWKENGTGHRAPELLSKAVTDTTAHVIRSLLQRIVVYQFHNTADTARIRCKWSIHDNRFLKEDAANIAPVLLRLRENDRGSYQRIVDTIRLIVPFFSDFDLEPEFNSLLLRWREHNSDQVFNAAQASDGMLRVLALVTLLLQPERDLPDVLILDEPELGLHPYAINVVGDLISAAGASIQVIAATQSARLLDCFEAADIVVVERSCRDSIFKRLEAGQLERWLDRYSLSELWEKNVIGGRPSWR